jgi:protein associated with RNAse G/E
MPDLALIGRETPVHITKYDGSYHRRWPARYVMHQGPLYLLTFAHGDAITRTADPAEDRAPTLARYGGNVYLYDDRWFNISRMPRDGRTWYYVNIATPVQFDGAAFHTTDLDLDISWFTDAEPRVLDEDEFLDHSEAMRYPARVIEQARAAVDQVLGMIGQRAFPFDGA